MCLCVCVCVCVCACVCVCVSVCEHMYCCVFTARYRTEAHRGLKWMTPRVFPHGMCAHKRTVSAVDAALIWLSMSLREATVSLRYRIIWDMRRLDRRVVPRVFRLTTRKWVPLTKNDKQIHIAPVTGLKRVQACLCLSTSLYKYGIYFNILTLKWQVFSMILHNIYVTRVSLSPID